MNRTLEEKRESAERLRYLESFEGFSGFIVKKSRGGR